VTVATTMRPELATFAPALHGALGDTQSTATGAGALLARALRFARARRG
jgi:hypothetical protein